eukprot:TRINITY_DN19296_c0_g1_i1.p1 TRINITY_DN19296_c0_g1~~TRINITY_DN19296_c0_g1_i1.p1  ORF type:complete len:1076 (+),score=331.79 TRINITY_DN19296_c0_g1_i1:92-3319(+)
MHRRPPSSVLQVAAALWFAVSSSRFETADAARLTDEEELLAFDCGLDRRQWRVAWSEEKQRYCCREVQVGCVEGAKDAPSAVSQEKVSSDHLLIEDDADDAGFDCTLDVDQWGTAWSDEKKDWCCKANNIGCKAVDALVEDNKAATALIDRSVMIGDARQGQAGNCTKSGGGGANTETGVASTEVAGRDGGSRDKSVKGTDDTATKALSGTGEQQQRQEEVGAGGRPSSGASSMVLLKTLLGVSATVARDIQKQAAKDVQDKAAAVLQVANHGEAQIEKHAASLLAQAEQHYADRAEQAEEKVDALLKQTAESVAARLRQMEEHVETYIHAAEELVEKTIREAAQPQNPDRSHQHAAAPTSLAQHGSSGKRKHGGAKSKASTEASPPRDRIPEVASPRAESRSLRRPPVDTDALVQRDRQIAPVASMGPYRCAELGGSCTCKGVVYFGQAGIGLPRMVKQNEKNVQKDSTMSLKCDVETFGKDPVEGWSKECFCVPDTSRGLGKRSTPMVCSQENGDCICRGRAYLGNAWHTDDWQKFFYTGCAVLEKLDGDRIQCSSQAFGGDPLPGVAKACMCETDPEAEAEAIRQAQMAPGEFRMPPGINPAASFGQPGSLPGCSQSQRMRNFAAPTGGESGEDGGLKSDWILVRGCDSRIAMTFEACQSTSKESEPAKTSQKSAKGKGKNEESLVEEGDKSKKADDEATSDDASTTTPPEKAASLLFESSELAGKQGKGKATVKSREGDVGDDPKDKKDKGKKKKKEDEADSDKSKGKKKAEGKKKKKKGYSAEDTGDRFSTLGAKCDGKSIVGMGWQDCAAECHDKKGCKYFAFAQPANEMEGTACRLCSSHLVVLPFDGIGGVYELSEDAYQEKEKDDKAEKDKSTTTSTTKQPTEDDGVDPRDVQVKQARVKEEKDDKDTEDKAEEEDGSSEASPNSDSASEGSSKAAGSADSVQSGQEFDTDDRESVEDAAESDSLEAETPDQKAAENNQDSAEVAEPAQGADEASQDGANTADAEEESQADAGGAITDAESQDQDSEHNDEQGEESDDSSKTSEDSQEADGTVLQQSDSLAEEETS